LSAATSFQDGVRVQSPEWSATLPADLQASIARAAALDSVDGNAQALRRETSAESRARFGDVDSLRRVSRRVPFDASVSGARVFRVVRNQDADVLLSLTLLLRDESLGWRLTAGFPGDGTGDAVALFSGAGSVRVEVPLFISSMPYQPLHFEFDRDVSSDVDGAVVELDEVWLWGAERHRLLTAAFVQTIGARRFRFNNFLCTSL